jgi:hypothetical protein
VRLGRGHHRGGQLDHRSQLRHRSQVDHDGAVHLAEITTATGPTTTARAP